jgi:hypothetical protein
VLLEDETGVIEAQPQQKMFVCSAVMGCSSDARYLTRAAFATADGTAAYDNAVGDSLAVNEVAG